MSDGSPTIPAPPQLAPDPHVLAQSEQLVMNGPVTQGSAATSAPGSVVPPAPGLTAGSTTSAHGGVGYGLVALMAANLMPLVGVAFLGWKVFPVVLLYWIENIAVGAFTVAKMAVAKGTALPEGGMHIELNGREVNPKAGRVPLIGFFCLHYGMFTCVHGIFVFILFSGWAVPTPGGPGLQGVSDAWWLVPAVTALVISHAVAYARVFLGEGEYLVRSPAQLMMEPYGRVVVLHLTIIFGGWTVNAMGAPVGALVLLVALKTGLDVRGYRRQHREAAAG